MGKSRRKEIETHLPEERIDELLREADGEHELRRIGFVKNLYLGDTIPEAAEREGRSPATGDRWADAWNRGGFEELMPEFGGGRPPKLDERERERLYELLQEGEPWRLAEIERLLRSEFDVEFHPSYLRTYLQNLGASTMKDSRHGESVWVVDETS